MNKKMNLHLGSLAQKKEHIISRPETATLERRLPKLNLGADGMVSWCRRVGVLGNDCTPSSTYTACTTLPGSQCHTPCDISWRRCVICDDPMTSTSTWSGYWSAAVPASQMSAAAAACTQMLHHHQPLQKSNKAQ